LIPQQVNVPRDTEPGCEGCGTAQKQGLVYCGCGTKVN
jgi:hypothetical protein